VFRFSIWYLDDGLDFDICFPAFLSSIHGVRKLVSLLLNSKDNKLIIPHYDGVSAVWDVENENESPTIPQFQKNWDNINIKRIIANYVTFNSIRDLARFLRLCRILVTSNTFS
jgi:hypothetical protein